MHKLDLSARRDTGGTVRNEADHPARPSSAHSLAGGFPVRKIILSVLATAVMLALTAAPALADNINPSF